jgi:uncharacterized protein (TIGR03663 family)
VALDDTRKRVLGLTAVALLLRLVDLGTRTAHWDEGRVGYWVLRSLETGVWAYRPIIHGPFNQHVAGALVGLVGPSDVVVRLPVALVGGLLPLLALSLRSRLSDRETTALALFLAVNPLLLYYSRFFRSDVPLAAFALLAVAATLRAVDTDSPAWAAVVPVALALAATTKENVLLYLLLWVGAGLLVLAGLLGGSSYPKIRLRHWQERLLALGRRHGAAVLGGSLLAVVVLVGFYAPRTASASGLGLWQALGEPGRLPALVNEALVGSAAAALSLWLDPGLRDGGYALYMGHYLLTIVVAAGPLTGFGLLGLRRAWHRPLVRFAGWWALGTLVVYPLVAEVKAPWLVIHFVLAMSLPAAVGLVSVWGDLRAALSADRLARVGVVAAVFIVGASHVILVGGAINYVHPTPAPNVVAQDSQPSTDLGPTLAAIERASDGGADPDLAYYGRLAVEDERMNDQPPAAPPWYDRLPLPWYIEARDVTVTSIHAPDGLEPAAPPVVVVHAGDRATVEPHLRGYDTYTHAWRLHGENTTYKALGLSYAVDGHSIVVFVDPEAADDAQADRRQGDARPDRRRSDVRPDRRRGDTRPDRRRSDARPDRLGGSEAPVPADAVAERPRVPARPAGTP